MWLLSTDRAELHFFVSPEVVVEGYAILSHVWGSEEQTFQDTQTLKQRCATTDDNPRDLATAKVREGCILAERHGYKWIWNDTCCIDKTSSAELSEAINSMFRYYSLADVCYAYLSDMPTGVEVSSQTSAFRYSQWHTRGWTLQELVAPQLVIFLSEDWSIIGTKAELAGLLEEATGVPKTVLTLEEKLTDVSIARRMSWAKERETTRAEDQAYSLLGIFGINMPTLYGEGRGAFRRLQEEIMRQYPDTSLFAWGSFLSVEDLPPPLPQSGDHTHQTESFLFADSPFAFGACTEVSSGDKQHTLNEGLVGIPTFNVTSYGVLAHLPTVEVSGHTVAVLFCSMNGRRLGLLLTPCPASADPSCPLYDIGVGKDRLILFAEGDLDGNLANVTWRDIYLAHRPPPGNPARVATHNPMNLTISAPFRFPQRALDRLSDRLGLRLVSAKVNELHWTGDPPATLSFVIELTDEPNIILVHLGRCAASSGSGVLGPHWANMEFYDQGTDRKPGPITHACPADHVREWPELKRIFALPPETLDRWRVFFRGIELIFAPCSLNPSTTLVMQMGAIPRQGILGYR